MIETIIAVLALFLAIVAYWKASQPVEIDDEEGDYITRTQFQDALEIFEAEIRGAFIDKLAPLRKPLKNAQNINSSNNQGQKTGGIMR